MIRMMYGKCHNEILCYLEIRMNSLEPLCIISQLTANVVAVSEDAAEVGPGPLDRHPGGEDEVSQHQLPLPSTHLFLEILHILIHQDVLKLHLKRKRRKSFTAYNLNMFYVFSQLNDYYYGSIFFSDELHS